MSVEVEYQDGRPFDEWVRTLDVPDDVKAIMIEFRPGTVFMDIFGSDKKLYVTGVGEAARGGEHAVMVSKTDPADNYEKAIASQFPIPVGELRDAIEAAKRRVN